MSERYTTFWCELLPIYDWRVAFDAPGPCSVHSERHKAERKFGGLARDESPADSAYRDALCECGFVIRTYDYACGSPRWRRLDTGEEIRDHLPIGALYADNDLFKNQDGWSNAGADGKSVVCVTPGGHWHIDARASNCTMRNDITHRCWVRHGTIGEKLHIDKSGQTCAAGAGSIMIGGWHGFLHHGELHT